ncbi:MAG: hypothetical protein ACXVBW_05335 [Bdellovibrionota bacterium]
MNRILTSSALLLLVAASSWAGVDTSSTKLKIYKFAVSASALCTNPVTVFSSTAGTSTDILQAPTIGTGTLAKGTYSCVIIEASKLISFVPAANTGTNCVSGTTYSINICSDGTTSKLVDGTSVSCSGGATNDQKVAFYLTTQSTDTIGTHAFSPPTLSTDTSSGIKLSSALTISADASGTFVVDGRGAVRDTGSVCDFGPPLFSFR